MVENAKKSEFSIWSIKVASYYENISSDLLGTPFFNFVICDI